MQKLTSGKHYNHHAKIYVVFMSHNNSAQHLDSFTTVRDTFYSVDGAQTRISKEVNRMISQMELDKHAGKNKKRGRLEFSMFGYGCQQIHFLSMVLVFMLSYFYVYFSFGYNQL